MPTAVAAQGEGLASFGEAGVDRVLQNPGR